MLCRNCPSRVDCSALCPEAGRYVNQDSRYQRERPVSMGFLKLLGEKMAWQEWLAGDTVKKAECDPPALDLSCLSSRQRQCLELHYFEGLSLGNIALRLSVSKGTVQGYVKEGLTKLRRNSITVS